MSVPKCKGCRYYDYGERRSYRMGLTYQKYHWCANVPPENTSRMIYSKDMKTSPKWCPKRKEFNCLRS